uniref:Uncharacterized protein n=1 Tax=Vombatus ursinus TaxID=29139 RepID=A0A4X2MD30_VOMUR
MFKSLKKLVEESRKKNQPEVDMCGISNMLDVHSLSTLSHVTQLVLRHNKLTTVILFLETSSTLPPLWCTLSK